MRNGSEADPSFEVWDWDVRNIGWVLLFWDCQKLIWQMLQIDQQVGLVDLNNPFCWDLECVRLWYEAGEVLGRQIGWMRNGEIAATADPPLSRLPPPSLRLHCLISATLSHWTSSSSSIYNLNAENKLMGLRRDNQQAWIHLYCGACLLWWCRMQNLLLKRVASFSKLKSFDKGRVITYGGEAEAKMQQKRWKCSPGWDVDAWRVFCPIQ